MSRVIVEYLNKGEEKVTLSADEDVTYVLVGLEAGEKELTIELEKEGVSAQILGLFLFDTGEVKIRTTQHHVAPNTTSDLLFKSVLYGDAKLDYKGLIKIEKKAQNSNAYQRNDNLLLSSKAHVETKPELEILADEVRCTHGATTGRLDESQLFYLMSRGLSRDKAQHIMIEGYVQDVINKIPEAGVRKEVSEMVTDHLKRLVTINYK